MFGRVPCLLGQYTELHTLLRIFNFERVGLNRWRQEKGKPVDDFITDLYCLSEHWEVGTLMNGRSQEEHDCCLVTVQQESNNCSIWPKNYSSISWCFVIQVGNHIFCHLVLVPRPLLKSSEGVYTRNSVSHATTCANAWSLIVQHSGLCDRPECIYKTCHLPLKPIGETPLSNIYAIKMQP